MRLKGFVLIGTLLLFISCCFSQVQTARNISMTPNSGGFYEYLPEGYNTGSQTYPLIVFIHGIGEVGNGTTQLPLVLNNAIPRMINQGTFPKSFVVNGQTFRFIIISPQFLGWPVPTDIQGILDYLVQHYRVDQSRIYLTGLSMGGGATWDYGGGSPVYANRLAALLPVAGASYPEPVRCRVITNSNLPVWATHNNGDGTVPVSYTNDYITNINQAPAPTPLAKKTIFNVNGHDAWSQTYDPNWKEDGVMNVYQWMLQYTNVRAAAPAPNQPPFANAGSAQTIVPPTSSVTVSGTGSDPDGTVASYGWSQVGGGAATITNPGSQSTTITGLTNAGTRTFRLTVTDNKGLYSTSDVNITVTPAPKSIPGRMEAEEFDAKGGSQYAVATNDPSGGGQHIIGIANGSWMDYNVNVVTAGTYTVNFRTATTQNVSQYQIRLGATTLATYNVPNSGGWANWTTGSTTITLAAGSQVLRVISTNNESSNLNWLDFALTSAPPPNQPPVANAGTNQTITLPASTVTLTGSGTDADGTVASYAWSQVSGTAATIANASSASTGISGLTTSGARVFRLTVTDNKGATNTSDVTITVNSAPVNQPPVANAGTNQTITLPVSTATLSGSATDPDGTVISSVWSQVSGASATIGNPTSFTTSISGLTTSGVRVFRLTVTDNNSATNTSDVTITENSAPPPPPPPTNGKTIAGRIEAENWDAKSGSQYGVPTGDVGGGQQVVGLTNGNWMDYNVNVTATGTYSVSFRVASTQLHAQLQLKSGATILGAANIPNTGGWDVWSTITITNVPLTAGAQTIRIVSNNNETCNFNWVEFVLSSAPAPNQPPVANAGSNQTITLPASSVNLIGSGTDADGTIASYAWSQISGTAATIANPFASSTGISGLTTAGTRVFRLTVSDNAGATATSDVTVIVNAAVPPPPTNGKTIPGRIEAENWDAKSGYQYAVATSDGDGVQHVVGITNGSYMDYNVNVTTTGTYTVTFRVATTQVKSQFEIRAGGALVGTINIPYTAGWSTWASVTTTVSLTAGAQVLRITSTNTESCNLNWIEFALSSQSSSNRVVAGTISASAIDAKNIAPVIDNSAIAIFPNPVNDQFVLRTNNSYEGVMKIQIVDLNGRTQKQIQATKVKGRNEINISSNGLASGTYIIRVQAGSIAQSIKMIKL